MTGLLPAENKDRIKSSPRQKGVDYSSIVWKILGYHCATANLLLLLLRGGSAIHTNKVRSPLAHCVGTYLGPLAYKFHRFFVCMDYPITGRIQRVFRPALKTFPG